MKEAVEIAKLRLFLKLVAEVDPSRRKKNCGLEALPDIDFNIRSGNTLVGFATERQLEEVVKSTEGDLVYKEKLEVLKTACKSVEKAIEHFQKIQTETSFDNSAHKESKTALAAELKELDEKLNRYLAETYGLGANTQWKCKKEKESAYQAWKKSHQPFHWLAEFYGIINKGGFDVVIGNPPYVEYSKVRNTYQIKGYETENCGNLYAFVVERAYKLVRTNGNIGLIIPISFPSTPRMINLRNYINNQKGIFYISNYADRPGTLFSGVHQKTSIIISLNKLSSVTGLFTTSFQHWYSKENNNERDNLLYLMNYTNNDIAFKNYMKIGNDITKSIFKKIISENDAVLKNKTKTDFSSYLNMRMMLWGKCFLNEKASNEYKTFYFAKKQQRDSFTAHINSSLFFLYWESLSDCWHITNQELELFINLANSIYDDNLSKKVIELESELENKKKYVGTVQTDYEYYHKKSKPIIDEIDKVLAKHYGFTEEELDFIINYDIKYRMGSELEGTE
jgi:hypothetical protein